MVDVDRCHPLEFWFPLDLENTEEILHIHELFKQPITAKVNAVTTRQQAMKEAAEHSDPEAVVKPLGSEPSTPATKKCHKDRKVNGASRSIKEGSKVTATGTKEGSKKQNTAVQPEDEQGASSRQKEEPKGLEVSSKKETATECAEQPAEEDAAAARTAATEEVAPPQQSQQNSGSVSEGVGSSSNNGSDQEGVSGKSVDEEWSEFLDNWESIEEESEKEEFMKAVKEDESLDAWEELGSRGEKGYKLKQGLLAQTKLVDWEEYSDVLVEPRGYRKQLLEIALDSSGYFSSKKVVSMLKKRFMWPGMVKDSQEYCSRCE